MSVRQGQRKTLTHVLEVQGCKLIGRERALGFCKLKKGSTCITVSPDRPETSATQPEFAAQLEKSLEAFPFFGRENFFGQ